MHQLFLGFCINCSSPSALMLHQAVYQILHQLLFTFCTHCSSISAPIVPRFLHKCVLQFLHQLFLTFCTNCSSCSAPIVVHVLHQLFFTFCTNCSLVSAPNVYQFSAPIVPQSFTLMVHQILHKFFFSNSKRFVLLFYLNSFILNYFIHV